MGKTAIESSSSAIVGKHPHGRGEDLPALLAGNRFGETPPRAWGRPDGDEGVLGISGNTPTGVGKTPPFGLPYISGQKHPHGRGEDILAQSLSPAEVETPPRAWGRRVPRRYLSNHSGNTPTGVGKTPAPRRTVCIFWKHPHGRGEDVLVLLTSIGL